ncbi:HAD-IIA family hydrolase [Devosia rhodophyticola]|uniref:HAD-IIA family hydrolase n=1 Tax=Devosia rhodophyticola TaxID=3026423 RepID=A0ABY7YWW0_9HYPH|nr:HAD-IIA family hydrolase [Devosia rhodophyticola]WDR05873.1 HAD-IIA family hydrolase [Devosia rhodophyticola]
MANNNPSPRPMPTVKGIIADLDGVVYRGSEAIEGAVESFEAWHERCIPYCFVTNNSTRTPAEVCDKLHKLGVATVPEHIVTSANGTAALMASRWPSGSRAYVIGSTALADAIQAVGFELCEEQADCVVVGLDPAFDYVKMSKAVRLILGGAVFMGTNPDLLLPSEGGFLPGNGAVLASIAAACRTEPEIIGKPEPFLIERAITALGVPREQTIMIGDQIATDIAAGQRAGVYSVLVQTGVPEEHHSPIKPDLTVSNLADLII